MRCYDYEIVIDLEFTATPDDVRARGLHDEIIEIGAVRVDARGSVVDTFRCFVRPCYATGVSNVVKRLTGIMRRDYLDAEQLPAALARLSEWVGSNRVRFVAWSTSDSDQIRRECAFKGIEVPACMKRWLDLQTVFARMALGNARRKPALAKAARWLGIYVDSANAHRALYDAQVTAQILEQVKGGEIALQHETVARLVRNPAEEPVALTASIAARCAGLEQLYRQLAAG